MDRATPSAVDTASHGRGRQAGPGHAQDHERVCPDGAGQEAGPAGRHRPSQAGPHLPDPQGTRRTQRRHDRRRRPRDAAGRVRIPARPQLQLPAGPRRRLRLPVPDPPLRPPDRRHGVRPDSAAQGGRALPRDGEGGRGQLRAARAGPRTDLLREPHAALSGSAHQAGVLRRGPVDAGHRPHGAHRHGAARASSWRRRARARPCCSRRWPTASWPTTRRSS